MPVTNEEVMIICANEYLEGVRKLKSKIEFRKNEVERMRSALSVAGINYESINSGSTSKDNLPEGVIKYIDLIDEFVRELDTYQAEMSVAISVIESLPSDIEPIASDYYLNGVKTWVMLELKYHYSRSGMNDIRRRISVNVYKAMPEEARRKLPKAI